MTLYFNFYKMIKDGIVMGIRQDWKLKIKYFVERSGLSGKSGPESTIKSNLVKQRHLKEDK